MKLRLEHANLSVRDVEGAIRVEYRSSNAAERNDYAEEAPR